MVVVASYCGTNVDRKMKDTDYLQIIQLHFKSTAEWLKLNPIWVKQENYPKHTSELDSDWVDHQNLILIG